MQALFPYLFRATNSFTPTPQQPIRYPRRIMPRFTATNAAVTVNAIIPPYRKNVHVFIPSIMPNDPNNSAWPMRSMPSAIPKHRLMTAANHTSCTSVTPGIMAITMIPPRIVPMTACFIDPCAVSLVLAKSPMIRIRQTPRATLSARNPASPQDHCTPLNGFHIHRSPVT